MLFTKAYARFNQAAVRDAIACSQRRVFRLFALVLILLIANVYYSYSIGIPARSVYSGTDPGGGITPPGRFYVKGSIRYSGVENGITKHSPVVRDAYGNMVFRSVVPLLDQHDDYYMTGAMVRYRWVRHLLRDEDSWLSAPGSSNPDKMEVMHIDRSGRVYLPKYSAFDGGVLVKDGMTSKALYLDPADGKILYRDIALDSSLIFTNGLVLSNDSVYIGGWAESINLSSKYYRLESIDPEYPGNNSVLEMGPGYGRFAAFDNTPSVTQTEGSLELEPYFSALSYFNKSAPFKHSLTVSGSGLEYGKQEDPGWGGFLYTEKYLDINNQGIITLGNENMAKIELRPALSFGSLPAFSLVVNHADEFNTYQSWFKVNPVTADLSVLNGGDYTGANTMMVDRDGFTYGRTVDIEATRYFTDRFLQIDNEGKITFPVYSNSDAEDSVLTTDMGGMLKFKSLNEIIPQFTVANGIARIADTIGLGGTVNKNGSITFADPAGNAPYYSILEWQEGALTIDSRDTVEGSSSGFSLFGGFLSLSGNQVNMRANDFTVAHYLGESKIQLTEQSLFLGNSQERGGGVYIEQTPNNIVLTNYLTSTIDIQSEELSIQSPNVHLFGGQVAVSTDFITRNYNDYGQFNTLRVNGQGLTYGQEEFVADNEYVFTDKLLHISGDGKFLLGKYRNNLAEDSVLTTDTAGNLKFKYFSISGGADSAWAYDDSSHIHNRNTGNVGIGTTQPTAKLHTAGSVRFESFKNNLQGDSVLTTDTEGNLRFVYMPYGSGGGGGATYNFGNGIIQSNGNVSLGGQLEDSVKIDLAGFPFKLKDGAQSLLSVAPNGNLGIGAEPLENRRLAVGGDVSIGTLYDSAGWGNLLWFGDYSNSDPFYIGRYHTNQNASELRIRLGDDGNSEDNLHIGYYYWNGSDEWQTSMLVGANGAVGIGSPELTSELSVGKMHGNKLSIGNAQWARTAIIATGQDQANGDYTDLLVPGANNNNAFLRINQAGNVGIGTLEPDATYRLSVNGKIRSKGLRVQSSGWADFVFDSTYQLMQLPELEKFVRTNKHLPGIPTAATVEKEGQDVGQTQVQLLQKIEELTLYIIELNKQVKELEEKNKKLAAQQEQMDRLQQQVEELRKMIQNK